MVIEVKKTDQEVLLNDLYMRWIRIDGLIPISVVKRFKIDCEKVRGENNLYNQKNS